MKHLASLVAVCFLMAGLTLRAAETLPATTLTQRGTLLYQDDLSKLDKTAWRAGKGKWEIKEGALTGTEIKEDKHGAVTRHLLAFTDVVIQFDIQLNGCRGASFSINDAKEHLARVSFNRAGFSARKDDHDHDGPDKAKDFGKVELPLPPGAWKTVVVELKGEEMAATMDGKTVKGSDPLIAIAKANFGFTVAGESASFRNLRVWEARK